MRLSQEILVEDSNKENKIINSIYIIKFKIIIIIKYNKFEIITKLVSQVLRCECQLTLLIVSQISRRASF